MRILKPLFAFLLILPFLAFQSDNTKVNFYTWNEGYPKGIKKNKIILVDVYTDWCGWCKKMDRDTYTNKDVAEIIDKHFIPIKFNPEKKKKYKIEGKEVGGRQLLYIISQGNHSGYPSTYFLFPEVRKVYMESGYQGPKRFKSTLRKYVKIKENGETGSAN